MRPPSKVSCQSLQNEHFIRDFLQKSSGKPHQTALPSSLAIPNNTRTHTNPNVTATFTSTTTRNLTIPCPCHEYLHVHTSNTHEALCLLRNVTPHLATSRLPAPATKIALPHLKARTKYCACHEKCQYHFMLASAKFAPHHTFGVTSTRSEHARIHQNRHLS